MFVIACNIYKSLASHLKCETQIFRIECISTNCRRCICTIYSKQLQHNLNANACVCASVFVHRPNEIGEHCKRFTIMKGFSRILAQFFLCWNVFYFTGKLIRFYRISRNWRTLLQWIISHFQIECIRCNGCFSRKMNNSNNDNRFVWDSKGRWIKVEVNTPNITAKCCHISQHFVRTNYREAAKQKQFETRLKFFSKEQGVEFSDTNQQNRIQSLSTQLSRTICSFTIFQWPTVCPQSPSVPVDASIRYFLCTQWSVLVIMQSTFEITTNYVVSNCFSNAMILTKF